MTLGVRVLHNSFHSRTTYIPKEGEAYARRHHAQVRDNDATSSQPHPLLSVFSEVSPFPSSRVINQNFMRICSQRHPGHSFVNPVSCFNFYAGKSNPRGYGPPIPNTSSYVFDRTCLPGKAPILEHVKVMLCSQDSLVSGGTFLPFIEKTLTRCSSQRQVSIDSVPQVTTLVFGSSTEQEVKNFIRAFNAKINSSEFPPVGFIPNTLYSLDVECVSTPSNVPFKIFMEGDLETPRHVLPHGPLPARVHLGFHDERFDIIFPWTHTSLSPTYQGDFSLVVPSTPLPDYWHGMFSKLHGYGIGVGLEEDLVRLGRFIGDCYRFCTASGPIKMKTVDLLVLLALSGYNSPKTCISVLNFMFTGGIVQKSWKIRCGLGIWATTDRLPDALSLYLQSEVIGVLNTAHVALSVLLLHWFVTPGIAAVVSRKTPVKFLAWFWRFISTVLSDASLPDYNEFGGGIDRALNPSALVAEIFYPMTSSPIFSGEEIARCIPPWRNVTGGGCPCDQLAIDHIAATIWPMLRKAEVKRHLRWESQVEIFGGFLTGVPCPSATPCVMLGPGCRPDGGTVELPELMAKAPRTSTVRAVYRKYRVGLPDQHILRRVSISQIVLLYVWTHPVKAVCLFEASSGNIAHPQFREDFDLVRPLILALRGGDEDLPLPDFFCRFRDRRIVDQSIHAVRTMQTVFPSAAPAVKRKLEEKLSNARKRLRRFGVVVPPAPPPIPPAVISELEDQIEVIEVVDEPPVIEEHHDPPVDAEDDALSDWEDDRQIREIRIVRYFSPPPLPPSSPQPLPPLPLDPPPASPHGSSDGSDWSVDLLVETPEWENL